MTRHRRRCGHVTTRARCRSGRCSSAKSSAEIFSAVRLKESRAQFAARSGVAHCRLDLTDRAPGLNGRAWLLRRGGATRRRNGPPSRSRREHAYGELGLLALRSRPRCGLGAARRMRRIAAYPGAGRGAAKLESKPRRPPVCISMLKAAKRCESRDR